MPIDGFNGYPIWSHYSAQVQMERTFKNFDFDCKSSFQFVTNTSFISYMILYSAGYTLNQTNSSLNFTTHENHTYLNSSQQTWLFNRNRSTCTFENRYMI